MFSADDHDFMLRALELAARGMFTTTPNPRVGCVIVREGRILGEGYTQPAGQNHAEVEALASARARGNDVRGATAYVSLEPCAHFGRTPPCATALRESGIARLVAAMEDPNPQVSGKGLAILREAGIEVRCGLLEREAYEMNIGFVSRMTRARPWVRVKIAASLDGRTALPDGTSQWITGEAARADGHRWRARACAILSGIGTVRKDDPLLNVRHVATPRQPPRFIIDAGLEIDLASRLVRSAGAGSAVVIVHTVSNPQKERELAERGCELIHQEGGARKVDLQSLVAEMARRGINELHVEGGHRLVTALFLAGCLDELLLYVAPCLLGQGEPLFDLPQLGSLDDRWRFTFAEIERVGTDARILARRVTDIATKES